VAQPLLTGTGNKTMSSTPQTLLSPQDVVQPDDAHTLTQQAKDCLLANDIDGFEKALGKALEIDVRDIQLNLRSRLAQDSSGKTFPAGKVPAQDAGEGSTD